jgi:hypothetical protein
MISGPRKLFADHVRRRLAATLQLVVQESRSNIMSKTIASLLVVGTIVLTVSQDASAGRRNCRNGGGYYYNNTAAPVVTSPAPVSPAVAQNNSGGMTYRSYSYDPAPVAAMQGRAPAYSFRKPTMIQNPAPYMFRADRKMWGLAENPYNY